MRRLFLLIFIFPFVSISAHAKLQVLCVAEKFQREAPAEQGRFEVDEDTRVYALAERDLFFTGQGNVQKAVLDFQFANLPGIVLNLEITETLEGRKISYGTRSVLKKDGREVRRGTRWISYQLNRHEKAYFQCDSYDKTESLAVPPEPTTLRERLRRQKLGIPGALRTYGKYENETVSGAHSLDAWDLLQQILRSQSEDTAILRAIVRDLEARGFKPMADSALDNLPIGADASPVTEGAEPGVELIDVGVVFAGRIVQEEQSWRNLSLGFLVEILRDPGSKAIRGYKVRPAIRIRGVEKEAGGGANTSGGRIMP